MFPAEPMIFSELLQGDRVYGLACLWSCELRQTRQGKLFLQLEFRDLSSTAIPGVMWDARADQVPECPVVVMIDGEMSQFQGSPQIKAYSFRVTDEEIAPYLPGTYRPTSELLDEFSGVVEIIEDADLRALVNACLEAAPGFWTSPSAIRFHGAYRGGLLEHTLHVARVCLSAADIYGDRVNRDLLIAAAILHDIGKSDAYDSPERPQPTEDERLIGHIVRGSILIERVARDMEYEGAIPLREVLHLVVSHHGELEFGAPVAPGTAEALILSAADTLDADVTGYFDHWRDRLTPEDWTYSNQRGRWIRRPAASQES
jgi:3'-5' exoribonuclease